MNFRVAKAWTVQAPGHVYRLAEGTLIRIYIRKYVHML